MEKQKTLEEMNALIKKTIHKKTVTKLPFDKEISPKKTNVTIKVGNCYQMETSLGPCIANGRDIMGLCEQHKLKEVKGWMLYKFWQQKPKSWFDAIWMIELYSKRFKTKSSLSKFKEELEATDLLDNDSGVSHKLNELLLTLETKIK